uniref:asparagine synthase-related protein n=1 Tax=Pantanalinema rosaneae TaxID=1620701 RepID=UPI003D6F44C8
MARALGARHSAINCDDSDIARIFPEVVAHTERPVIRTAPAPLHLLSRFVREEGFKVVLTGEGADEVFAGYDIFKEAAVRRFCARRPGSRIRPHLFRRLYPYLPGLQKQNAEYLAAFFGSEADAPDDPLFSHGPRLRGTAAAKLFFSADLRADRPRRTAWPPPCRAGAARARRADRPARRPPSRRRPRDIPRSASGGRAGRDRACGTGAA